MRALDVRRSGAAAVAIPVGAILALAILTLASSANAGCVSPITACGCTITKSGLYIINEDIDSTQGLTSRNGCIDIKASNVALVTEAEDVFIEGPGGGSPSGIGIHVLKGSNNDFISPISTSDFPIVDGWNVGVLIEGHNVFLNDFISEDNGTVGVELNNTSSNNITDFDADDNGTNGVVVNNGSNNNVSNFSSDDNGANGIALNKAGGNNISDFDSEDNVNYGAWLKQSSKNKVNDFDTDDNGNIGVYVGCSGAGPKSASCQGVGNSNQNRIFDATVEDNTNYGIAVDLGDSKNIVTDTTDVDNGIDDLFDANSGCDSNQWFLNDFDTANKTCID
jgi:Right handed beta helix region